MPYEELDRSRLKLYPLSSRRNRAHIETQKRTDAVMPDVDAKNSELVAEIASRIVNARREGKSRMAVFGAHAIKNGLSPILIRLIENGWFTHLATNGAGIIHDWEFAYLGATSEDVRENVSQGKFGLWDETGYYINLAIIVGAYEGRGYGESVGALVEREALTIPSIDELHAAVDRHLRVAPLRAAAAARLLHALTLRPVQPGQLAVPHPFKQYGLQAAAFRLDLPYTGHPMIGHDIIYTHPANDCAAIGQTAQTDFLRFAHGVANLDGGVYLSVGSAVMSPMIFEKSLSMARNLARQQNGKIENHYIAVVDLQPSHWDWRQGEPPEDNPDYYLRYNKTFNRMGGALRYLSMDNRNFFHALLNQLDNA